MIKPITGYRLQLIERCRNALHFKATSYKLQATNSSSGFTLIETLIAITLLATSIVAPMSLTTQSLSSAYYARDQMTAFHLAQEAIESVRSVRDANILNNEADLLEGIPQNVPFVIDSRDNEMTVCDEGTPAQCPPLRIPSESSEDLFYAYRDVDSIENIYSTPAPSGWTNTRFRRTILAEPVPDTNGDEIRLTVIVSWQTGAFQVRTITMYENLYRWIDTTP
jgi:prepilin-type N-terminal cleavage/methylation domain-containing protein